MKQKKENAYEEIIDRLSPISLRHPRMSIMNRAAQFSPFAALTGHDEAIKETARQTQEQIELDETQKAILDEKLQMLIQQKKNHPKVTMTYFEPDERKDGGEYKTVSGHIRKIDSYQHMIYFEDQVKISFDQLFDLKLIKDEEAEDEE